MPIPLLLIALPLVCGLFIACIKGYQARKLAVFASSIIIASLSVYCVVTSWASLPLRIHIEGEWISWSMLGLELVMAGIIAFLSVKYGKKLSLILALIMTKRAFIREG